MRLRLVPNSARKSALWTTKVSRKARRFSSGFCLQFYGGYGRLLIDKKRPPIDGSFPRSMVNNSFCNEVTAKIRPLGGYFCFIARIINKISKSCKVASLIPMTPLSVRFFDLSARGEPAAYRYGGQCRLCTDLILTYC